MNFRAMCAISGTLCTSSGGMLGGFDRSWKDFLSQDPGCNPALRVLGSSKTPVNFLEGVAGHESPVCAQ